MAAELPVAAPVADDQAVVALGQGSDLDLVHAFAGRGVKAEGMGAALGPRRPGGVENAPRQRPFIFGGQRHADGTARLITRLVQAEGGQVSRLCGRGEDQGCGRGAGEKDGLH